MPAGRPPKFSSPEDLQQKIDAWLLDCEQRDWLPTKGNLALYLDTTRDVLGDYEDKPEYSNAIKTAYAVIENAWAQRLKGQSVAGVIFYLKNAFRKDWRDRTEIEHGGDLKIQFASDFKKDAPAPSTPEQSNDNTN